MSEKDYNLNLMQAAYAKLGQAGLRSEHPVMQLLLDIMSGHIVLIRMEGTSREPANFPDGGFRSGDNDGAGRSGSEEQS